MNVTGTPPHFMKFFYVYVLKSFNHDFIYVGFTEDIKRREEYFKTTKGKVTLRQMWYIQFMEAGKVIDKLKEIFKLLSSNRQLESFVKGDEIALVTTDNRTLLSTISTQLVFPVNLELERIFADKSPLEDDFVSFKLIETLIQDLSQRDAVISLNHIGFCYKTDSQTQERQTLTNSVPDSNQHLYEENSNDQAKWYFIGNTDYWNDPLIELLPVTDTSDKWLPCWLPHIHVDIDTKLTCEEIESITKRIFNKSNVVPFRVTVIDNIVYTIRLRLGIVSGVNIDLDLSTNSRNVQVQRQILLKKIIQIIVVWSRFPYTRASDTNIDILET